MAFKCTIPAVPTVQQDDDTIRITRWDFEPGAVTGWHQHGWPYFVVMLTDAILNVDDGKNEKHCFTQGWRVLFAPSRSRT